MGFCDVTDAEMRALKRQRRAEAAARPVTVRLRGFGGVEFEQTIQPVTIGRRYKAQQAWKAREWSAGRRECGYCAVKLVRTPDRPNSLTVDHKHPLALHGDDAAHNWIAACLACNARKGSMTETEFRALLAAA